MKQKDLRNTTELLKVQGSTTFVSPDEPGALHPFYPYFYRHHLSHDHKHFYRQNGHFMLVKNLSVEVIRDLDQAEDLWQLFTPNESLFDTWEFRYAFWRGYRHKPYFLCLKLQNEIVAVLPLWYESDKKAYYWFGSWWQEDNTFFVKDPVYLPLLLAAAPRPLTINAISPQELPSNLTINELVDDDPKFILRLDTHYSSDMFLDTLKKKRRYNLKRDKRIIDALEPTVTLNDFSSFDALVALSKKRFAEKQEETDWEDKRRIDAFKEVIALGLTEKSYKVRMVTVRVGNTLAAADLVALYKGTYYPLKCGYNVSDFPGIGNWMNLWEIDDAASLGMKKMDFLEINYGWKDKWFEPLPLLKLERP